METKNVNLSSLQYRDLNEIITALVGKYQTEYIICFGCKNEEKATSSCFIDALKQTDTHYFLLMITTEVTRIEHEVQDFVNGFSDKAKITIVVHCIETVKNGITQGSRFFTIVCRDGIQLFSANGLHIDIDYPNLNPDTTLAKAEKNFYHRYCMALGFLEAAEECFDKEFYNNSVFMLHQAVEQACIAMIKVYLSYRSDIHNLSRLLNLCFCFSGEPAALFPRKTDEDQRLFQLLQKSYSDARYKDEYKTTSQDADILCTTVRAFVELAEQLCLERINHLRTAVEAVPNPTV